MNIDEAVQTAVETPLPSMVPITWDHEDEHHRAFHQETYGIWFPHEDTALLAVPRSSRTGAADDGWIVADAHRPTIDDRVAGVDANILIGNAVSTDNSLTADQACRAAHALFLLRAGGRETSTETAARVCTRITEATKENHHA